MLAILFPVVNTRFLSFETHSYWIHHILIYIGPGYLLTVGGPFTAEPITDRWWPILTVGIAFFYHFSILQGLGMVNTCLTVCNQQARLFCFYKTQGFEVGEFFSL